MKILKIAICALSLLTLTNTYAQDDKQAKKAKKFAKVDKNSDGALDFQEFEASFKSKENKEGNLYNFKRIFDRKDKDGNGSLSLEEYLASNQNSKKNKNKNK